MSLRLKLLLLGLATLVLPWAGCRYAREMESALRQGEQNSLQAVVADHRRLAPGPYRPAVPRGARRGSAGGCAPPDAPPSSAGCRALRSQADRTRRGAALDGYSEDWPRDPRPGRTSARTTQHRFGVLTGVYERMLYVLLEVHDAHPLFDAPGANPLDPADLR